MTRKTEGWQLRLAQFLGDAARRPFQPGRHDCALFAAGAVHAMTGLDLARGWRGKYRTLAAGQRALERAGYTDHVALAAAHLPGTQRPRPGDIAVIDTGDGQALGVVQGHMAYVLRPAGLGLVPLTAAIQFFEV